MSIVRDNLMTCEGYSPYCGNNNYGYGEGQCTMPRTFFNGSQFECPICHFQSQFEEEFIRQYKDKWGITGPHPGESNSRHEIFSRSLHRVNALAKKMEEIRNQREQDQLNAEIMKNPEVRELSLAMDRTTAAINSLQGGGFADPPPVCGEPIPSYRALVTLDNLCDVVSKKHRVRLMRIQNSSGLTAAYMSPEQYAKAAQRYGAVDVHPKGQDRVQRLIGFDRNVDLNSQDFVFHEKPAVH